jgi:uncharacterized membrane protein YgcG
MNRLYQINPNSGAASAIGSAGAFTLTGTDLGVDFNPVVDRLRVVSEDDENLRLNPADGTLTGTDSDLQYAPLDPNAPADPNVVASAYTNNFLGATSTSLYGLDSGLDIKVRQDPPNAGTLSTVGPLGFDISGMTGIDILDDGTAWVAAAGTTNSVLFSVNLQTGQMSARGTVPGRLLGLAGEPTGAAGPLTGQLNRLSGNQLRYDVTNAGMRPIEFIRVELMDGYTVTQVSINSGPQTQCNPIQSSSAAGCGPFTGPGFWGAGQGLGIVLETDRLYPDNGGADLFACAAPCSPYNRDAGPFAHGGPAPAGDGGGSDGGGGGSGGGGSGGGGSGGGAGDSTDFDLDGDVDLDDLATLLAAFQGSGVTIRIQTPAGVREGDSLTILSELLANFGRSSAAQRRRPTVIARRRTTLTAPQSRRVRVPLTRAGRRLYRGYTRKRLRATLRLRVTYRPASGGPVQTRTFREPVRLRVVKPKPRP